MEVNIINLNITLQTAASNTIQYVKNELETSHE
jgi:hypothetical protein